MIAKAFKRMAEDHKNHLTLWAAMLALATVGVYLIGLLWVHGTGLGDGVSLWQLICAMAGAYIIRLVLYLFIPSVCEIQGCHNHKWDEKEGA